MKQLNVAQYLKPRYLKNPIVLGTFFLTFAGLLTKLIGFFYRIFLSRIFKEEGLGIIGLIAPVSVLVHSICAAGIQSAITRYVAASHASYAPHAKQEKKSAHAYGYLFTGIAMALTLSSLTAYLVFTNAAFISRTIIGEPRCTPLLQISALSFPLASLHSCINGFFYGLKKASVPASSMIIEQLTRVFTVYVLYSMFLRLGAKMSLSFVCLGMFAGEFVSASFSSFMLFIMSKDSDGGAGASLSLKKGKELLMLAFPISLNRICISLLSTVETLQLPKMLISSGLASSTALSVYGVFSGMAFPLIMFPSAVTGAASSLLMPSVSEAQAANNKRRIRHIFYAALGICFALGVVCMFFFLLFANILGDILFHSEAAAAQIRALAFVCPFLYMSGTLASILHGLGKTGTTFVFNLLSISLRLGFVFFLVPSIGFSGYIYGILCSQIFLDLLIILALRRYIVYN